MTKIVLKFTSGLDANKEYSFEVTPEMAIAVGRDPANQVVIHEKEDVVSRKHAIIQMADASKNEDLVVEDTSSNGVFVNRTRVNQRHPVTDGDQIQFGQNGPVLQMTMDPKPIKATRVVDTAALIKATRLETPADSASAPGATREVAAETHVPAGIGKATLERRIDEATLQVKKDSNKKMINAAVLGVAALIGVGGFAYYRSMQQDQTIAQQEQNLARTAESLQQAQKPVATELRNAWGNSTVLIEASWQLVEYGSDRVGYHRYRWYGNEKYPLYREMRDGTIRPVVTFNPNAGLAAFGGTLTGTGFVVTADGLVMTNKHVSEPWSVPYDFKFPGIVVRKNGTLDVIEEMPDEQKKWVPTRDAFFIEDGVRGTKRLIGRNVTLNVVFPNSSLRVSARNSTGSDLHDVALIKIDVAKNLKPVELSEDAHTSVQAGHKVVQLGYPGMHPTPYLAIRPQESSPDTYNRTAIQDVSVNEGIVSKFVPRINKSTVDAFLIKDIGDYIEMNVNDSGPGNSGGPLFDTSGKVIGLYTADVTKRSGPGQVALAVPIRYGIALLDPTRPVSP